MFLMSKATLWLKKRALCSIVICILETRQHTHQYVLIWITTRS
jgi:hypothetical protein